MDSSVHRGGAIDFSADIEITGTPVLPRRFNDSMTGSWINVVTATATQRLHIYKAFLSPNADITGEVQVRLGSTVLGGINDAKEGGEYILFSATPDYARGAYDDDFQVTGPSGSNITINYMYEVELADES